MSATDDWESVHDFPGPRGRFAAPEVHAEAAATRAALAELIERTANLIDAVSCDVVADGEAYRANGADRWRRDCAGCDAVVIGFRDSGDNVLEVEDIRMSDYATPTDQRYHYRGGPLRVRFVRWLAGRLGVERDSARAPEKDRGDP